MEGKIEDIENQIRSAETAAPAAAGSLKERDYWRYKEDQLRQKEAQLRQEKAQLRQENAQKQGESLQFESYTAFTCSMLSPRLHPSAHAITLLSLMPDFIGKMNGVWADILVLSSLKMFHQSFSSIGEAGCFIIIQPLRGLQVFLQPFQGLLQCGGTRC